MKTRLPHHVLAAALLLAGVTAAPLRAASITTGSLVREMTDLHRLTYLPQPMYRTVQFSSFDHRSALPGGPHWFANSDGFGHEPTPNFEAVIRAPDDQGIGEYLVCDVPGPGAIVRVWTAAIEGSIRLFLDEAAEPVYDGPADQFFLRPYAPYCAGAGLDPGLLDGTFSQRNAGYYPIPFAARCRIVWTGDVNRIHFYQVQIRLYDAGAEVATFRPEDLSAYRAEIEAAAAVLADPQGRWACAAGDPPLALAASVPPREKRDLLVVENQGARAIERLTLRATARDLDAALRQTVLHILFDGYPWGQVQAPIGDFFGAAPGINPFNAAPFTVEPNGEMTCRFVMPFERSLRIAVENRGEQPVAITGSALLAPYDWQPDRSLHFRARWRVDHGLTASNSAVQDLPFLIASGAGTYVGTSVMLLNPNPVPTPAGNWWGEGDEKIFVDADVVPSTFGTGSEDYFNYAWSAPDIFGHPYCGQPRNDGPANRGFVTNHRWHILDDLPFRSRLSFYMELFSHEPTPGMSYARIAYHYGRPGIMDEHVPITDEDVRRLELPARWQPAARGAARNSVFYEPELLVQPGASVREREGNLWSDGRLLVWTPAAKGDVLTLTLPVVEEGDFLVHITAALTPRSGTLSAQLDGAAIGLGGDAGIVDLFDPFRTLLRTFSSRPVALTRGDHILTLRSEGPSSNAPEGQTEIGLDFLAVQKQ